jgi:transcriptional regulator with XRE-family HTH domain
MNINPEQIRAARALLDWSTADLAKQAEMTINGINKIERGHVQAHKDSLARIQSIFEGAGIEFLDFNGVRFRPEDLEVLNGKPGVTKFWDRVFAHAQTSGGIIRQNGIPEGPLDQCAPEAAATHRERMLPLVQKRKDIFIRAILEEGDTNFLCTNYADYRWNPKESPPPVPNYVFGDTVAIFAFEADPSPKIILITSPTIASAYIKQFDRSWELAQTPTSQKEQ